MYQKGVKFYLFAVSALLCINCFAQGLDLKKIEAEIAPEGDKIKIILLNRSTGKELDQEQTGKFEIKYSVYEIQDTEGLLGAEASELIPYTAPIKILDSPAGATAELLTSEAIGSPKTLDKGMLIQVQDSATGETANFKIPNVWRALAKKFLEEYDRVTEEAVITNPAELKRWGLKGPTFTPADYGFPIFEKINIPSTDNINLVVWYIRAQKQTDDTLLLIHGRTSNHLKPMRYLEIVKELELDKQYNILLPDLRNSGESTESLTYFGYKFSDDIITCLTYLAKEKEQHDFVLMGSSQGGMGTEYAWWRLNNTDKDIALNNDIDIEKIILDCPLINVRGTIYYGAKHGKWYEKLLSITKLVNLIVNLGFTKDVAEVGGNLEHMYLSFLFANIDIPVLIQESYEDQTTPASLLEKEMELLKDNPNIKCVIFEKGQHVKVYEANKEEYTNNIRVFMGTPNL